LRHIQKMKHLRAALFVMAVCVGALGAQRQPGNVGNPVRGLALMSAFRDSLPGNSGNGLRCLSCHLDNGTRPTAMPWTGSAARYPRYRARPGYEESLARRVNECIARSLAGKMLPEDGREMRDMLAYLETLRERPRPSGVDSVRNLGDGRRGRREYANTCARCHGANGQGDAVSPPMWGPNSFAIGAGMARQYTFATFVKHNMPFDHSMTLSKQAAADIAAYVLSMPRQDHPGKERDWPRGDAPVDVAYATDGARRAGRSLPTPRPLLARRVSPDSLRHP
jgi:thiosulfate dehydrogenase